DVTLGSSGPWRINSLAYRPDGRALAAGTQNYGVQLWDPVTGRHIRDLNDQEGEGRAVAYSPDGRAIAAVGANRTVRIWDTAPGSARPLLRDGAGQILSLAFSPDGRYLAATNGDKTASVWDLIHNPRTSSDRAQP